MSLSTAAHFSSSYFLPSFDDSDRVIRRIFFLVLKSNNNLNLANTQEML